MATQRSNTSTQARSNTSRTQAKRTKAQAKGTATSAKRTAQSAAKAERNQVVKVAETAVDVPVGVALSVSDRVSELVEPWQYVV